MSSPLPRLRHELDFQPSPIEERPGLMMRDPYGYAESVLIIPAPLVPALSCFDGVRTESDLRQALVEATGEVRVGALMRHLTETLDGAGFLHTSRYEDLRAAAHARFAASPARQPAHAGGAYPEEAGELRELLADYLAAPRTARASSADLLGIAAPHVSLEGGWTCYRESYAALPPELGDAVFIVLGTSHYGAPARFGLTRKNYVTPLGAARTEVAWVDELARRAPGSVVMEDYSHAIEHSIEFQVAFLQLVYGPDVRLLPVLCGSFGLSALRREAPEQDPAVASFFDALAELTAREGARARYVLGIDLAHMGRRYGDHQAMRAGEGLMSEVERRDRARLERVAAGDAAGFWALVAEHGEDDLKWCGTAPLYTLLRVARPARGELREYCQWNIDEQSVVSCAALSFHRASDGPAA